MAEVILPKVLFQTSLSKGLDAVMWLSVKLGESSWLLALYAVRPGEPVEYFGTRTGLRTRKQHISP